MSAMTAEKLVYMANQIARNVLHEPDPAGMVADHIASFWTARMKDQIFAEGPEGLDPVARKALERLGWDADPAHHTRATDPAVHGSDAG
jgi:formate dehydrogenase subunit delta